MIGLSASAVLVTLILVVDLQLDLGMSGQHLTPSHGRLKFGDNGVDAPGSAYNSFRKRFLQRTNGSRESPATAQVVAGDVRSVAGESSLVDTHDDFRDVEGHLKRIDREESDYEVIGRTDSDLIKKMNKLTFQKVLKMEIR